MTDAAHAFGAQLANNLTKAISNFHFGPADQQLRDTYFRTGQTCGDMAEQADALQVITFGEIGGLYLVCGLVALVGIALGLWGERSRLRDAARGDGGQRSSAAMLAVASRRSHEQAAAPTEEIYASSSRSCASSRAAPLAAVVATWRMAVRRDCGASTEAWSWRQAHRLTSVSRLSHAHAPGYAYVCVWLPNPTYATR